MTIFITPTDVWLVTTDVWQTKTELMNVLKLWRLVGAAVNDYLLVYYVKHNRYDVQSAADILET